VLIVHLSKLNSVLTKMREFIRKCDYRVKEEITREEATAWVAAVEVLKGYKTSVAILNWSGKARGSSRIPDVLHKLIKHMK